MSTKSEFQDTQEPCPQCHEMGTKHIWNGAAFAVYISFICPHCGFDTMTFKRRGKVQ